MRPTIEIGGGLLPVSAVRVSRRTVEVVDKLKLCGNVGHLVKAVKAKLS